MLLLTAAATGQITNPRKECYDAAVKEANNRNFILEANYFNPNTQECWVRMLQAWTDEADKNDSKYHAWHWIGVVYETQARAMFQGSRFVDRATNFCEVDGVKCKTEDEWFSTSEAHYPHLF